MKVATYPRRERRTYYGGTLIGWRVGIFNVREPWFEAAHAEAKREATRRYIAEEWRRMR